MLQKSRVLEEKMKSLKNVLLPSLAIAAFLMTGAAAKADPLTITFDSPYQRGYGGETLTFSANVTNTDAVNTIDLNSYSYNLASPLGLDGNDYFLVYAPLWLDPSSSSGDFEMFTVFIQLGTPLGLYSGSFEILGGIDPTGDQDEVGTANFDVEVYATPEPGSYLLFATGLLALGFLARRKLLA